MIKLIDYREDGIDKYKASEMNAEIIQKGFKREEGILSWILKSNSPFNKRSNLHKGFLSLITKANKRVMFHRLRYLSTGTNKHSLAVNPHEISYDNLNLTDFHIFLLNKEEASPYIKEMIVENLEKK